MSDEHDADSFVDRLSRQGEEALGRFAEELIGNPIVNRAVTSAFDARERAVHAQEAAMGALNLPSAADVERLTRRLRSVSQRLESIEDSLDRIETGGAGPAIERRLDELSRELAALRKDIAPAKKPATRAKAKPRTAARAKKPAGAAARTKK